MRYAQWCSFLSFFRGWYSITKQKHNSFLKSIQHKKHWCKHQSHGPERFSELYIASVIK
jgi:hypothetical protein